MDSSSVVYLLALFAVALGMGALGVYAWQHRDVPGSAGFAFFCFFITEWMLALALRSLSDPMGAAWFWQKAIFVGVNGAPIAALVFVLGYVGRGHWLAGRRLLLLLIVPILTQIMIETNHLHGLFYRSLTFYRLAGLTLKRDVQGPWFWVHMAYGYLLIVTTATLLVWAIWRAHPRYRIQAGFLLIAILPPILINLLEVFKLVPEVQLSTMPFGFAMTGLLAGWTIFRYQFLDLAPVARSALVEQMIDGMLVIDTRGRIVDLNPSMGVFLNRHLHTDQHFTITDLLGQPVERLLSRGSTLLREIAQQLEVSPLMHIEQDETQEYYDVQITPLQNGQDKSTGYLILLHDVEGRVHAEQALREAKEIAETAHRQSRLTNLKLMSANVNLEQRNVELDAYARTVAHDLKNPIALLLGHMELLQESWADLSDEMLQESLQQAVQIGGKLVEIVDALLFLSQVRQTEEIETKPLAMADSAAKAVERLHQEIQWRNATVTLPPTLPQALGYGPWIEEVWVNYLSNALKYGGDPPQITIGAEVEADTQVRYWVQDNGPGLTDQQQSQLFTEFIRLHRGDVEGHGLGLAIVRRIVERLGGRVGVSCLPDQGCTFFFTLPTQ